MILEIYLRYLQEQDMQMKYLKLIDYPTERQPDDYSCGLSSVQTALAFCGIDVHSEELRKSMKPDPNNGVDPKKIINVLKKYKINYEYDEDMTVDDLKKYIDDESPIIICLQAWAKDKELDYARTRKEGHYVTVIGYNDKGFICEDPALQSHRGFIPYDELEYRWRDFDKKGNKYNHFGIAILSQKSFSSSSVEVIEGLKRIK
jgi:uncharacterized protein YvpB